jgi:hypothetical protein
MDSSTTAAYKQFRTGSERHAGSRLEGHGSQLPLCMESSSDDRQTVRVDEIIEGQVWRRRKTGELFRVWGVFPPHFVSVSPQGRGGRQSLDVRYNNFLQEFERVEAPMRRRRR